MKLKWVKEDSGEYLGFEEKVDGRNEKDHLIFYLDRDTPGRWSWRAVTPGWTICSHYTKPISECKKDAEEFANKWEKVIL
jgi:hypothetical protein